MSADAKKELVDFLERRAFRPVLDKSADDYSSDSDRRKLGEVQDATRRELERYRDEYSSARDVIDNYKDDLTSEPARKVTRELRSLDLPALDDVEDEFRRKVQDLGMDY